jgi:hypothetical protein
MGRTMTQTIILFVWERRNWDIIKGYCLSEMSADEVRRRLQEKENTRDVLWFKEIKITLETVDDTLLKKIEVEGATDLTQGEKYV